VVFGILLFLLGLYLGRHRQASETAPESESTVRQAETDQPRYPAYEEPLPVEPDRLPSEPPVAPPATDRPLVAIVIDDLGRSVDDVRRFEGLGVPISYAVLPFETRTAEVVEELRRRDAEFLVHLPMEGSPGADPGPGALWADMDPPELGDATRAALQAVPGAVGVNNHMGSVLSADPGAMATVLQVVAARGLFFLDSRTTAETVGYTTAVDLGIPAAQRQVFLDGDREPESIRRQFREALARASERGSVVVIGHPYEETVEVLRQEVAAAREIGYRFVPVSYLLDRTVGEPQS
jgi:polysaccharide deacetylase 2 family uncharacterized protein YibQ